MSAECELVDPVSFENLEFNFDTELFCIKAQN